MPQFDFLIVGAGPFGSTFARQATDRGHKCLVIDRRPHIAGNMFDERVNGINVHKYGPHIFHTNDENVWQFVNQFSQFTQYEHRVKGTKDGKVFPVPINLMTMYILWGVTTPAEAIEKIEKTRVRCENPQNLEDWIQDQVGSDLYELIVKGYTEKQWGRPCSQLPSRIIRRLPIRMNWDDRYHGDRYSAIPNDGYTTLIRNILDGVDVDLGVDYFDDQDRWDSLARIVVYSGPIDQFFDYKHGDLEYRSVHFETEDAEGDVQGCPQLNYTDSAVPYTRRMEWKHFERLNCDHTIITREYSQAWERGVEPYYPISDDRNQRVYEMYKKMAKEVSPKYLFGGRLGTYKYMDMDQTFAQALRFSRDVLENT